MAEHEPRRASDEDVARDTRTPAPASNDHAAAASEPMDLQRLPKESAKIPPGRQRTGDPPAPRPRSEA